VNEAKIVVPPGTHDPRAEALPKRESVEQCPKCGAPKEKLGGGPRKFPVLRNKLLCLRCGEEIPVDG